MTKKQESFPAWAIGPSLLLGGWFIFSFDRGPAIAMIVVGAIVTLVTILVLPSFREAQRVQARTLEELLLLTPRGFEEAVADLFRDMGYSGIQHVGGSGDLSVDLRCRDSEGRQVLVQCKRYAPGRKVGSKDLQTFIGMIYRYHAADRGVFVTTSSFTEPAVKLSNHQKIDLIDGSKLADLIAQRSPS